MTVGAATFGMDLKGSTTLTAPDGKKYAMTIAVTNSRTETVKEMGNK